VAQKIQTLFIDDIDGTEAEGTVRFGLDGAEYEIDLNAKHADALRKALAKYIDAARRSTGTARRPARTGRRASASGVNTTEVREWAKAQGIEYEKATFPWVASGRALGLGRPEGSTKLLFAVDGSEPNRLIGAGIVGVGAGELIAEGVVAIEMAALAKDVALSIHPHPTLSETLMEAAEVFFGTSTDIYRPKRP